MKVSLLRPFGLALALAVALTAGGVREAVGVAAASSGELLAAELPAGVTLASAPTPVLATALRSAVRKNSDKALPLLRVALLSRKKKKKGQEVPDFCDDYVSLTRAALEVAPGQARKLVEEAILIAPGCSAALGGLIGGGGDSGDGSSLPAFGTGYVLPGFAGAPGFSGSNPGGGIFVPVTPTTNR